MFIYIYIYILFIYIYIYTQFTAQQQSNRSMAYIKGLQHIFYSWDIQMFQWATV